MKLLHTVLIALALFSLSCSSPALLSVDALKNTDYRSSYSSDGMITLTDGTCTETIVPGSASKLRVSLSDKFAFGDLNGDSVSDAAVIIISNSGGSGTFYDVCAVINRDGAPQHVASAFLGDRITVNSVTIASGIITVEMVIQGPYDPMSRATQTVIRKFTLKEGELQAQA